MRLSPVGEKRRQACRAGASRRSERLERLDEVSRVVLEVELAEPGRPPWVVLPTYFSRNRWDPAKQKKAVRTATDVRRDRCAYIQYSGTPRILSASHFKGYVYLLVPFNQVDAVDGHH